MSEKNNSKDEKNKGSELEKKLLYKNEFIWDSLSEDEISSIYKMTDDYIKFLKEARTERERTAYIKKLADANGFKEVKLGENASEKLKPGDKIYYINRDKNINLVVIGKKPLAEGIRLVGAHMDTPRIDLKIHPLYEDKSTGFALLKTHYYGGIKKYQWATIPLALTGVVVLKDGTRINVDIGKNSDDPVFMIPDLLIHLASTVQGKRTMADVIKAREMNILAGATQIDDKKAKEKFKLHILKILNEKYGMIEEDFHSSELTFVSAIPPRYMGFDKSMVAAAGQDDGACTYFSAKAIFDLKDVPEHTAMVALFDKEEIGSNGPTGAQSVWFRQLYADLLKRVSASSDIVERDQIMRNTKVLSADVTAAMDPSFKSVHDPQSAAIFGKGVSIDKYSGSRGKYGTNDATAEYVGFVRKLFNENKVPFQMGALGEVDVGGGNTIAVYFAQSLNADVIDVGTPVINMHSPYEVTHVCDLFSTYQAYFTFLQK